MKLTAQMLRDKKACGEQVELFVELFGESVSVTQKRCAAHANEFDWEWAAEKLLPKPAWAEFDKVRDAAWAEFDKVRDVAWAEYDKVCNAAWAEYYKVRDAALAKYHRVCAVTFARLYNGARDE